MQDFMGDYLKKLALWYTRTFKPIMTHDELEPIMATLGFLSLPPRLGPNGVVWKEYKYGGGEGGRGGAAAPPRMRLPYKRIDGLHICTYRAFVDGVSFYVKLGDVSDIFHIRGMPLHRIHDRNKKFLKMDGNETVFVYREGTLDPATYDIYHRDKNDNNNNVDDSNNVDGYNYYSSVIRHDKGDTAFVDTVVRLKDIIV